MRILVFGKTGQVATELARAPGNHQLICLGRDEADFTTAEACAAIVRDTNADAIINAVAYTAVDKAEEDEATALQVNATTPAAIARAAAELDIPLVHISTDYVFDGSGGIPWPVDAPTAPLGAYGRTKLAGEDAIRAANGPHAILRTSWVVSAHGANFVKTMLRLGRDREALTIVADQIGGPTPAADIARACLAIAEQLSADPTRSGTYHFAGTPDTSWAGFAREIFAQSGISCAVTDIPSAAYPTPAERPLNSRLDTSLTRDTFGIERPDWRVGLNAILKELGDGNP
ncbi:dTDP-4-dehydrorhamnose reductase [Qingshengfaniella alkalisoli]|uniref:dTDP-4-dehydrorhamnose reductase n=1 Tax=Qingshengfaniella alkalisoli TaxID=2599296 RepID=A0A5B8IYT7_9RHOB|nr:dTDP-4-dehydrorhamnose reductase [Qingshengfaniella alkalisoli]QDY70071.1 dTDP-4-dehydrorhamnose reductase [Qingshengfaniella alkalisoli]